MSSFQTREQVSAGGVVFQRTAGTVMVVLIAVGENRRWQLPKGLVNRGEDPAQTALREVREETGLESALLEPIDQIKYWYFGGNEGQRIRFHKTVHFYLMRFLAGTTADHDQEVEEARWVGIDEARALLAFKSERAILEKARRRIQSLAPT